MSKTAQYDARTNTLYIDGGSPTVPWVVRGRYVYGPAPEHADVTERVPNE